MIVFGIIGNFCFAFKSIFQIIKSYKTKTMRDVSSLMMAFDFFGNICCSLYLYSNAGLSIWLQYVNYIIATILLVVLFVMKWFVYD